MDALDYSMVIAASRDDVWRALTTAEGLASWLCLRARVEPVVGGAWELHWCPDESRPESDSTLGCRVLAVDRPRLIRFTWRGSDAVADVMNVSGAPVTEVEVRLFPGLDGTRVEVCHSGWADGPGWERARAWFDRAWQGALERLAEVVAG